MPPDAAVGHPAPIGSSGVDALVHRLHQSVIDERLDPVRERSAVLDLLRQAAPMLDAAVEVQVLARVSDRIAGLGPLASLLADESTTDVLVNGPGPVWIEQGGQLIETDVLVDDVEIRRIVERLTAASGRRADLRRPVVDVRLHDGSRAHVVLPPIAVDGPCLTIRRFGRTRLTLDDFAPPPLVDLLRSAVRDRMNMLVSGGTGSGKTSLLNAICAEFEETSRTITIEDAAELRLPGRQVVRLETRPASAEGLEAVEATDLVRAALRMRPDRIIVGEVRGPEALAMLWAMNTGHDGSMTTCHANSPADALRRLEHMALTGASRLDPSGIRHRIRAAIDLVVQVERTSDGRRRIVSIAEPGDSDHGDTEADLIELADTHSVRAVRNRAAREPR